MGQITEAFPWDSAPTHLIRDRDACITSSSLARPVCVRFSRLMQPIATMSGRIYPWVRTHRSFVLFSGSVTSPRRLSSAAFIINIAGCSSRQGQPME